MRLHQLALHAYGRFKNESLEFPAGEIDFHMVVGPNEAGKSTLLSSINDLFYGFPKSSPYSFLYEPSSLRIGAEISGNGTSLRFNRRKGNKKTLLDDAGTAISDDSLAAYIGADQATFQRVYGLNHKRLEEGSLALLDSSGNAGQAIFSAAAGLGSLQEVQDRLEMRAKEMYAPTRAGSRAYYQALDRLEDAQRRLKELTVVASRWNTINKEREEADRKVAELRQLISDVRKTRERLQRISRVAPMIQQLRQDRLDAASFENALLLPEDSAQRISSFEARVAAHDSVLVAATDSIQKKTAARANLTIDDQLAGAEAEIKNLLDTRAKVHDFPRQIEKRRTDIRVKAARVAQLCHSIGLPNETWETIAKKIPTAIIRAEVAALADEEARIVAALDTAIERQTESLEAAESARKSVESLPASPGDLTNLRKLLDREVSLGAARRWGVIQRDLDASNPAQALMSDLLPWTGSRETLAAVRGPSEADMQAYSSSRQTLAADISASKRRLRDIELERAAKRAETEQLRNSGHVVAMEVLREARESRDLIWAGIAQAKTTTPASEAALTEGILNADQIADSRFDTAANSAELEGLMRTLAGLDASHLKQAEIIAGFEAQVALEITEWEQSTAEMKIGPAGVERVREWLGIRDRVLTQWKAHEVSRAALIVERTAIESLRRELHAELSTLKPSLAADAGLADLITAAKALVASEAKLVVQIDERRNALAAKERLVPVAKAKAESAGAAHQKWKGTWEIKVKACGLPETLGVASVKAALDAYREIETEIQGIRDVAERNIATMERDLSDFETAAKASAAKLFPSLASTPAMEIPARLHELVSSAITAARDRARLDSEIAEHESQKAKASNDREILTDSMAPLLERGGVETVEELHELVQRSSQRRIADQRVVDGTRAVTAAGGGFKLDVLEQEFDAEDLSLITNKIHELDDKIAALDLERDAAVAAATRATQTFDAINGQSGAAEADADAQSALADMAESLEEYVRLSLSAKLLRWAVERYREEKQDPILRRAGQIYSQLTGSSFVGLGINYEGDAPVIVGRRSSGDSVRIEEMSDGSRDQLFLALRVAALESELERGNRMPFIADDLLMTYDDKRASATFSVLFDLARQTQVIYLTHHDHLVEIARSAGHPEMNVVRLTGGVPTRVD